jgi:radical SAM modification target selenobiotic family peptide
MERSDLRKVLAGFGLASLLAGVAFSGCTGSQKSSCAGSKPGAGGTDKQQGQSS